VALVHPVNVKKIYMKQNLLKLLGCAAVVSVFFSGCIKDEDVELTTQGSTFIKILEAPETNLYFSPFTDIKSLDVFSLRKDAATNADLNKATPVKLTLVPDYIDQYNDDYGTDYEVLPDSLFTSSVTKTGNVYDMSLTSGQAGREFSIKLNGAKWDYANHKYALAFALSDVSGNKISSGKDTIIATFSIINEWHGEYHSDGVFHHPANGDRAINEDKDLITAGVNSVEAPLGDLGGSGYYMILTINPDNTVTITPSGATPNIDQHWGPNYYDSDTQTFHLHYSYNTSAPRIVEEAIKRK
jgi:hypothetical protein